MHIDTNTDIIAYGYSNERERRSVVAQSYRQKIKSKASPALEASTCQPSATSRPCRLFPHSHTSTYCLEYPPILALVSVCSPINSCSRRRADLSSRVLASIPTVTLVEHFFRLLCILLVVDSMTLWPPPPLRSLLLAVL